MTCNKEKLATDFYVRNKVTMVRHSICKECLGEYTGILTPDILNSMKAPFTMRISGGNNQIEVGASDKYIPVCRKHFK
jgi:thymidine kinase